MRKTLWKYFWWTILAGFIIAGSLAAYMWFMPHRNVRSASAFAEMEAKDLVLEFTADAAKANAKYLSSDGNSKVLILEGRVESISSNQSNEKMVLLKEEGAKAGVSCTFTKESDGALKAVKKGDIIKVKGAISAGNSYDPDLDLTEHAVLIQCTLIDTKKTSSLMHWWEIIREWFLNLGEKYHVNPFVFGAIYVGAIPFFFASLWWLVINIKNRKPIVFPVLVTGFFFLSAYLYLIIAGRNIPVWVYLVIAVLILYSTWSTIRNIRKKISRH